MRRGAKMDHREVLRETLQRADGYMDQKLIIYLQGGVLPN